jgi:hypothetical protein
MNSSSNLSYYNPIFDVILSNTESYDYKIEMSDDIFDIKISREFKYYDIKVIELTSKFDIKLDTTEYNDIEIVIDKINYSPDELTILVGNNILTEDNEILMTEDGFELLY